MKRYVPCLSWTVCGIVLLSFWSGRLSRDAVEPWLWSVVGLILIAAGIHSGLEARKVAAGQARTEEERA